jgi:hypothetical protein
LFLKLGFRLSLDHHWYFNKYLPKFSVELPES